MGNYLLDLLELVGNFIEHFPNSAATIFGFFVATGATAGGYLLKRPLQRQAIEIGLFRAQLDGMERVNAHQTAHIAYLEGRQKADERRIEALTRRLEECEARNRKFPMSDHEGVS